MVFGVQWRGVELRTEGGTKQGEFGSSIQKIPQKQDNNKTRGDSAGDLFGMVSLRDPNSKAKSSDLQRSGRNSLVTLLESPGRCCLRSDFNPKNRR